MAKKAWADPKKKEKKRAIFILGTSLNLQLNEQRLWFAVLERAILDYEHPKPEINSKYFFTHKERLEEIAEYIDMDLNFFRETLVKYGIMNQGG